MMQPEHPEVAVSGACGKVQTLLEKAQGVV
jgi:hypothetical protein